MQTIKEKIKQRRRQMLVHSYLYYEMDYNIVDDHTWSKWAVELAELQKKYPKESAEVEYADLFSGWDGSSGAHLKYDASIKAIALRFYAKETHRKLEIVKVTDLNSKSVEKLQKSKSEVSKSTTLPHKAIHKTKTATRSLF